MLSSSIVCDVIKQPSGNSRLEHAMFEHTVNWFRRSSDEFAYIDRSVVKEVVQWCTYQSFPANSLVIKQGDFGDAFYALLRGHASAHVLPDSQLSRIGNITKGQKLTVSDKHKLGPTVKSYAPGGTFGELALIHDNNIRSASIIADDDCVMAVVPKDLYDRLLKSYKEEEYKERLNICNNFYLSKKMKESHKEKLANSMEKIHMEFDSLVAIQLKPCTHMYFIVK